MKGGRRPQETKRMALAKVLGEEPTRKDMKAIILRALLALTFLNIPSEAKGRKGETLRQATAVQWSPEKSTNMTRMVNLTHDAEEYITKIVGRHGKLKTFNFTGGYRPAHEPPVHATVKPLIYGAGCIYTEDLHNPKCKDIFTWDIDTGIVSPLSLKVNDTVRLISKNKTVTVTLEFNGASSITWSQRRVNPSKMKKPAAVVKQECNFSAEADFKGYVAYRLEEVRGDMPNYDTFDIVNLKNHTKGLEVHGDTLVYNVTGTFRHELVCKNERAKPRGNIRRPIK
ncbi:uncharacterized protein LOC119405137 [Rhipicephalus sanguineus]|uniref:uncharacterized protein LOC119405137 n=1 Tax=Rhipicephalus sanguineus TaxID=34632 RepID=UPI001895B36C|nr:uncharacterized protein LOC119405137 [Rhipicephalus sanguineus]